MFDMNTLSEKELMNATKNITTRLRLNRELDLNREFSEQHLIKSQYGDYDKYNSASVKVKVNEYDQLEQDKFFENLLEVKRKLPTHERDLVEK